MKRQLGFAVVILGFWAGICAVWNGMSSPALSQGKSEPWEILIAYGKDDKPRAFPRIALRPNVTQSIFVHLKNNDMKIKKNLVVTLVRLGQGNPQILGQTTVEKIGPNQQELLKLKPIPPAKDEVPAPADLGPPFQYQIWLKQEGKKDTVQLDLPVTIQHPHEYVKAQASFDRFKKRLTVEVRADPEATNPPCKVELVLLKEAIPGILPPKEGLFKEELTRDNPRKDLHALNVQFQQGIPPKNGRVFLTIDGFERAYMFKCTFEQESMDQLGLQNRARLLAPRFVIPKQDGPEPKPDPKDPKADPKDTGKIPVKLEIDGELDQDAKVEVAFDRSGERSFVPQKVFPGLREQTLSITPGPEGLLCKNAVKDWNFALDISGVLGKRSLRVRILDAKKQPLPLADELNQKDEALGMFAKDAHNTYAPLWFEEADKAVYGDILIDASAPEGARFVDLPGKATPGEKLRLKATAKKRDADQAPIQKAQFFVGEPKEPGLAGKFDPDSQLWQADLTVPADAKDKLTVTVQLTTATGLSTSKTGEIALQDKSSGGAEASKITGKVTWNSIAQPKAKVQLQEKGKAIKEAVANDKGVYVIDNVPPGDYTVAAAKTGFKGSAPASVPKGKAVTVTVDVGLKRIP